MAFVFDRCGDRCEMRTAAIAVYLGAPSSSAAALSYSLAAFAV